MKSYNEMTIQELGKRFEALILRHLEPSELEQVFERAVQYNLRSVVVPGYWLDIAKERLNGTGVQVGTGGSFPMGLESPAVKAIMAKEAVDAGCEDFEVPINWGALKSGRTDIVEEEVTRLREATAGVELKVILEVCQLNDEQIKRATQICVANGVDFVKSSSGQYAGPTMEQACLIVDGVAGSATHSKVSGVQFPKPMNAYMYLMAGIEVIGSQNPFEILDGIEFMRRRGVVTGPVD